MSVVSGILMFDVLGYVAFAMLTHDWWWFARKTHWTDHRLWINAFGRHSTDAPPLVWERHK